MVYYDGNTSKFLKKYKKDYVILKRVLDNAKKLGVRVEPSRNHLKKLDVFSISVDDTKDDRLLAQIGGRYSDGRWYGDYATYLKKPVDRYGNVIKPDVRRDLYLKRHKHEQKDERSEKKWNKGQIVKTPSFYADKILWS